jgi:hypothetical protein
LEEPAFGSLRVSSNELNDGTMTSSSPLTTRTGCWTAPSVVDHPVPRLDGRNLSLNRLVAYGRVQVLGAFFQALQEVVGCRTTLPHWRRRCAA